MKTLLVSAVLVLLSSFLAATASAQNSACESAAQLSIAQGKILGAESVPAGAFKSPVPIPEWMGGDAMFKSLPSFCRVALQLTPSADSDIRAEVWLPSGKWNGRLQVVGNGGFAGEINYSGLAAALLAGYAAASTDTGHAASGVEAGWALGHPEKVTDFGWRAIHVTTLAAKEVIRARYGNSPKYSYFFGCSNGGRQALMEAQRFPEDFNGILAGAPANYWTHLVSAGLWNMQALTNDPASYIPSAKLPALAQAVNAACDALDGTKDGVVDDPRRCHFQPEKMLCTQDGNGCLTAPQITALEKLYEGPHTAKSGRIFPGFLPGAEEGPGGWGLWITGPQPGKSLIAAFTYGYFANMVYEKADWSYNAANVDDAVKLADEKTGKTLNATDANLAPFRAHGGKLILYHGWNDPAISALNTIDYWQSVRGKLGGKETDSFARLYMLPGVQHCSGGPGLDEFGLPGEPGPSDAKHNVQAALELWVEKGTAPDSLIVSKTPQPSSSAGNGDAAAGKAKMTRPLCPYPQEAKYKGTGDPNEAASFTCSAP